MKKNTKKAVAVGVGVGAVAVAGALTYLFTGKRGVKNKAAIKKWVETAKKEVLSKIVKVKRLTQEGYVELIDKTLSRYEGVKDVTPSEIKDLKSELKGHWKAISTQVTGKKKPTKSKK